MQRWNHQWLSMSFLKVRRQTYRLLSNLAMLTALNRPQKLRLRVRCALKKGVGMEEEITEILIQAAIYCGTPAVMGSFRTAGEILGQLDSGP